MAGEMYNAGLGGLPFGGMLMDPQQAIQIPQSRQLSARSLQGMREFSLSQRLAHPFGMFQRGGGVPRGAYGRGMGPMDLSTGVDPSTMNVQMLNNLLGQYGQSLPENPRQNAFLPDTGFFGNHPRLAGALEGAVFGGANTGPASTVGEGISNALRGMLSGNAERSRVINQQFTAPFAMAQQVQNLRRGLHEDEATVQRARLEGAQADYYGNKESIERDRITSQETIAANKAQAAAAAAQGRYFMQQSKMDDGHASVFRELGYDPFPTDANGSITSPPKEQWAAVNQLIQDRNVGKASAGARVSAAAAGDRQQANFDHSDEAKALDGSYLKATTPLDERISALESAGMPHSIKDAKDPRNWDTYNTKIYGDARGKWEQQNGVSNPQPMPGRTPKRGSPRSSAPPKKGSAADAVNNFLNSNAPQQAAPAGSPTSQMYMQPNQIPQQAMPFGFVPGMLANFIAAGGNAPSFISPNMTKP